MKIKVFLGLTACVFMCGLISSPRVYALTKKNVVIASEPGRFKAWPANGGLWRWGNEILAVYTDAAFLAKDLNQHTYDRTAPIHNEQARSLDGGRTWRIEKGTLRPGQPGAPAYGSNGPEPRSLDKAMTFTHPDFVFHIEYTNPEYGYSRFWYSNNRGRSWEGPFAFPSLGYAMVASRTNYVIKSPRDMLLVITASNKSQANEDQNHNVLVSTSDGGLTWKKVSTIGSIPSPGGANAPNFSIMGTLTALSDTALFSMSRNLQTSAELNDRNWIDAFTSNDRGQTWKFTSRISQTYSSPTSVTRLPSGRLVVTYGYRVAPFGIRARTSDNNGKTWSEEIVLRDDGGNFDLGYTRDVLLGDGKLLTIYYFNNDPSKERYIAGTIWDPEEDKKNG
jgi:hypothetical protein